MSSYPGIEVTPEQKKSFRNNGCLYIPSALAKSTVQPVKTHILNELKRLNIWSAGRALSQKLKGVPVFQQTGKLSQLINYPGLSERLISKELHAIMCQLAGAPLAAQDVQLLISLPHKLNWTIEGLNWHRDISKSRTRGIPGVQAFVLLDNVTVKGGATLALAGSHRLESQSHATTGISERIGDKADHSFKLGDIELSIIEMAGRAGDVYLMDMRLLHTPSINSTKNVRMMATARYFAS